MRTKRIASRSVIALRGDLIRMRIPAAAATYLHSVEKPRRLMRTTAASAPAGSPENERSRRRARRPTSAEWGRAAGWKAEPRAGEKRVRLCCRGNKAPRRSAWRRNSRRRSPGRSTPCGAMPRRSVPLVRRLSEPRVRDSAAVHAEHRSVPWPFSFPVPPKNIAGRRNHNVRPVLRHSDRRRTAFKCGRKPITSTWGSSLSGYPRGVSTSKIKRSREDAMLAF